MKSMITDEDIERGIRRDPRFIVRLLAVLLIALLAAAWAFSWFAGLDVGSFAARGFSIVTETPPPGRTGTR